MKYEDVPQSFRDSQSHSPYANVTRNFQMLSQMFYGGSKKGNGHTVANIFDDVGGNGSTPASLAHSAFSRMEDTGMVERTGELIENKLVEYQLTKLGSSFFGAQNFEQQNSLILEEKPSGSLSDTVTTLIEESDQRIKQLQDRVNLLEEAVSQLVSVGSDKISQSDEGDELLKAVRAKREKLFGNDENVA